MKRITVTFEYPEYWQYPELKDFMKLKGVKTPEEAIKGLYELGVSVFRYENCKDMLEASHKILEGMKQKK